VSDTAATQCPLSTDWRYYGSNHEKARRRKASPPLLTIRPWETITCSGGSSIKARIFGRALARRRKLIR
jgi:hypothetical protein